MKYGTNEAVSEIVKRSDKIRRKRRENRITGLLTCVSVLLVGALASTISVLSINGQTEGKMTDMGSFLLPAETGGYITVAVIACALGITITLIAQSYRKKRHLEDEKEKGDTINEK